MPSLINLKNLPLSHLHCSAMILFTCWNFFLLITPLLSQEKSATIIIVAPSYTMNTKQPWAEALVIRDDKIIFVGDKRDALTYQNSVTQLIERSDGMVLPGFIDSHVHLLSGGIEMNDCRLHDLETPAEIYQTIRDFIKAHPDDEWIRGSGWALPIFPDGNPRKEWLDKISTDKPIFLVSVDAHSAWLNSKALTLAGINAQMPDPPNGRIERYPKSNDPSGVLREDAMGLVEQLLPLYTKDQIDGGLKFAVEEANRMGITALLDAGTEGYVSYDSIQGRYDGLDSYR